LFEYEQKNVHFQQLKSLALEGKKGGELQLNKAFSDAEFLNHVRINFVKINSK